MTMPLLNRTLATFLSPELGFFGFVVPTRRHTPFISGLSLRAGDVAFRAFCPVLHPLSTWLYVARNVVLLEKARVAAVGDACARGAMAVVRYVLDGAGNRRRAQSIEDAILCGRYVHVLHQCIGRNRRHPSSSRR
jgi:hypothetical protein